MKKILLLGGSAQQVIAIETAKKLGYYTILCDYLTDNPGQNVADKFFLESTTDKEKILQIAESEKIDGIVAYASDPAAPTAAFVAEKLGLPTNPYRSVDILCNKDKFREFLKNNGFNTPLAKGFTDKGSAIQSIDRFNFPVIIKPVDSSGSKGATVLKDKVGFEKAVDFAFSFSRGGRIVIEEFIEKDHPYLIGGDLFISDGKIIMWGLMNCHRDSRVNPLVPVGKSYPPTISDEYLNAIKSTLQIMIDKLQIKSGAMNVELVVDSKGRVFPIDVGPRNGGNMIPDLLGCIFNVDVVKMTIKSAMGEMSTSNINEPKPYYATHNLHSAENGIYDHIEYSPEIEKYIIRKSEYKKPGDDVEYFDNASKALGILFLKFDSKEQMTDILDKITTMYNVILKIKS